jgi:hypothetical protein
MKHVLYSCYLGSKHNEKSDYVERCTKRIIVKQSFMTDYPIIESSIEDFEDVILGNLMADAIINMCKKGEDPDDLHTIRISKIILEGLNSSTLLGPMQVAKEVDTKMLNDIQKGNPNIIKDSDKPSSPEINMLYIESRCMFSNFTGLKSDAAKSNPFRNLPFSMGFTEQPGFGMPITPNMPSFGKIFDIENEINSLKDEKQKTSYEVGKLEQSVNILKSAAKDGSGDERLANNILDVLSNSIKNIKLVLGLDV